MKLPNTPWRRRSDARRRQGGFGWRYWLGIFALFIASFVLAFYLFFPVGALKDRIEQEVAANSAATLTIDRLQLTFPPSFKARGLAIDFGLPSRTPETIQTLQLSPLWGALLTGNPGVAMSAALRGGTLDGELREDGTAKLDLASLSVSEPLLPGSPMAFEGVLTQGSFVGRLPPRAGDEGRLKLTLDRVRLTGLENLGVTEGNLNLGTIALTALGKGNSWRIDSLDASGGDLTGTGSGTILLADPVDRSRLNLMLVLTPTATLDRNLKDLLDLFGDAGRDGNYRFRITGTAAKPLFAK